MPTPLGLRLSTSSMIIERTVKIALLSGITLSRDGRVVVNALLGSPISLHLLMPGTIIGSTKLLSYINVSIVLLLRMKIYSLLKTYGLTTSGTYLNFL